MRCNQRKKSHSQRKQTAKSYVMSESGASHRFSSREGQKNLSHSLSKNIVEKGGIKTDKM